MKDNKLNKQNSEEEEMLPEYDFREGMRGKHYKALQKGYTVKIYKADGTEVVRDYKVEKGSIRLDPDVRKYFPDSESVNAALRSIITLFPRKRKVAAKSS